MKRRFQKLGMWKIVFTLFVIPLLLTNCQDNTEEVMINDASFKTVSKQEVSNLLSNLNKQSSSQKNSTKYVEYDINDLTYEDITNTDAKLAVIPCKTKNKAEYSRVLMLNIHGENRSIVFNMFPSNKKKKSKHFDGEITIATLEGELLRAFRVQEGQIINSYSSDKHSAKSFDASNVSSKDSESSECRLWCGHQASNPYCICNVQELDEVVVSGSTSIEYISTTDLYGSDAQDSSTCEIDCNTWNPGPGGSSTTTNTDCPTGFVKDKNGNCVEKPCEGDPVKNPKIASQTNSGIKGGLFGTCTRFNINSICNGIKGVRKHAGVDILNPYGAPIFAMYDGTASYHTQRDRNGKVSGAGHYVAIESNVNGVVVRTVYFHLQQTSRASGSVRAGDIIGYQGNSGNLANAIKQNLTQSHVHIKVQENSQLVDPLKHLKTTISPQTGQVTNPCQY